MARCDEGHELTAAFLFRPRRWVTWLFRRPSGAGDPSPGSKEASRSIDRRLVNAHYGREYCSGSILGYGAPMYENKQDTSGKRCKWRLSERSDDRPHDGCGGPWTDSWGGLFMAELAREHCPKQCTLVPIPSLPEVLGPVGTGAQNSRIALTSGFFMNCTPEGLPKDVHLHWQQSFVCSQ